MARRRLFVPGLSHHIYHRGNNRCDVFRDEHDRRVFLDTLGEVCAHHDVSVHGYALLTTHYHAQVTAFDEESLPRMMQSLGRRYVRYFNDRHRRTGTLWEGRYQASLLDSDGAWFRCLRYVELNPVRAQIVSRPDEWQWSSYRANATGLDDRLLTRHSLLQGLGGTPAERFSRWAQFCGEPASERELSQIRSALKRGERFTPEE